MIGSWHPTPDELYNRALAFSALALHAETVEDLHKFLSLAPQHAKRDEAKVQARDSAGSIETVRRSSRRVSRPGHGPSAQAGEAGVWLVGVYLRQDAGDRLLSLLPSLPPKSFTPIRRP